MAIVSCLHLGEFECGDTSRILEIVCVFAPCVPRKFSARERVETRNLADRPESPLLVSVLKGLWRLLPS